MRILMQLAIAAALAATTAAPAYAVDKTKAIKQTTNIKKPPTVGGTVVGGGNGVAELTSWDCKAVGGTVVVVSDDRCGASRRYCRMPDTNAVCIEEKLQ
ncbi:MAG: hypothetical protein AB7S80_01965 [Rhizobiaceae bacterium]